MTGKRFKPAVGAWVELVLRDKPGFLWAHCACRAVVVLQASAASRASLSPHHP
jgi:hypothetical protein